MTGGISKSNNSMDNQLSNLLQQTGFTAKESQVYLALLELGEANVTQIADKTELKRSIIYVLLEGLIKRGYATEIPNQKINRYQAVDPSKIYSHLTTVYKNFGQMLPVFKALYNKDQAKPKIYFFEGVEGALSVYRDINNADEALFFTSISKLQKFIPDEVEGWIQNRKKGVTHFKGKHLIEDTSADREWGKRFKPYQQDIRIMPKEFDINMDLSIFHNKVALTSIQPDGLSMVLIESPELFNSMKLMFELAWQSARALK